MGGGGHAESSNVLPRDLVSWGGTAACAIALTLFWCVFHPVALLCAGV